MRLSAFISANLELILADWVSFARQQQPAASGMDQRALLDHGRLLLEEIAADMRRPLDDAERQAKSEGQNDDTTSRDLPSRAHAQQRERQGFMVEQMVAEYRALRATVVRLWTASNDAIGASDLEDMIRFNEAVDQAIAESLAVFLAEVEKSRHLFLGVLGHDLRGPLATIATCAAADQKRLREQSPTAAIVLRSVAQMKALLDDLVAYTGNRLGAGLTVDAEPLRLEAFVRDTLNEIQPLTSGRTLELEVEGNTEGEWDPKRLHQALSNLVFNALKYGDPGTAVHVSLDGRRRDDVTLAVENAGRPIPADQLKKVFDPLVRASIDGADAKLVGANMGLGLYVVREIAAAHRGTIEVTSGDAVTRFELRLPRKASPHAE